MSDVLTLAGSPSSPSRSAAVLAYARRVLEQHGLRADHISVRDLPPEDLIYGRYDSSALLESAARIRQARAVIVATPIYKAAYSGVLKTFLDLLPQSALAGKTVLPIATGGAPVHMLAIDYALRPVLAALGAQHIMSGVFIVDAQVQFSDGTIQFDQAIQERLDGALRHLVDALNLLERTVT